MSKSGALLRRLASNLIFHTLFYLFAKEYRLFDSVISEAQDVNKILFFCLLAISFVIIQYALTKITIPAADVVKHKTILIVSALLAAYVIITYPLVFKAEINQDIYIYATGEKNVLSKDSEVWISAVYVDGTPLDMRGRIAGSNEWKAVDDAIFCEKRPSLLHMKERVAHDVEIVLTKHPYSGKVQVWFNDGVPVSFDLYSENGDSIKLANIVYPPVSVNPWEKALFYLSLFLAAYPFLCVILLLLDTIEIRANPYKETDYKTILTYMALPIIVWGISWCAFFPAAMLSDSLDQWDQLESVFTKGYVAVGTLNNAHPVSHTLFMGVLTLIWDSPGIVVLFQILSLSLVVGCFLARLQQLGIPRLVTYGLLAMYSFSPVNSIFIVNVTKDVLYSISLFSITFLLFEIYISQGDALKNKTKVGFLIPSFLGTSFRHNGIITLVAGLGALFFGYRKKAWKNVVFIVSTTVALLMIFKVIAFNSLHASYPPPGLKLLPFLPHIASVIVNENGYLREADREVVHSIMPEYLWEKYYNPYYLGTYEFNDNIRAVRGHSFREQVVKYKESILPIFIHVLYDNPVIVVDSWITMSSIIWRFEQPPDRLGPWVWNSFGIEEMPRYTEKLKLSNSNNFLTPRLKRAVLFTQTGIMKTLFWRHGLYLFLLLVSIFFIIRNQGIKGLIVTVPCVTNILSLFIVSGSQSFRYLYPSILIVPFLLMISFIKPPTEETGIRQRRNQNRPQPHIKAQKDRMAG